MNVISQKISLYKFNASCILTKHLGTVTNFAGWIFFFFLAVPRDLQDNPWLGIEPRAMAVNCPNYWMPKKSWISFSFFTISRLED